MKNIIRTVDYSKAEVPAGYMCAVCGATNCKLWREYQTGLPQLLCARCAAKNQHVRITDIDADGLRPDPDPTVSGGRTDQIGEYVPAVPIEDGNSFWGYTSVPDSGVAWWGHLPTLPPIKKRRPGKAARRK